jgi:hypothetical protein
VPSNVMSQDTKPSEKVTLRANMHGGATNGIPQNLLHLLTHHFKHEEGHKLGVRHVEGLGHVAPI